MRKIKVSLDIPFDYYCTEPRTKNIVLNVNNRVADIIEKMLANDKPVYKKDVENRKMLNKLNLQILEIGYEILIESTFDPYYDCADESIKPHMEKDIKSGNYKPDLESLCYEASYPYCGVCPSYDEDEEDEDNEDNGINNDLSTEEIVDKFYDELLDDYLYWCNQFSQEFKAEVYGVDISCCQEDEIEYEILSLLPIDSADEVYNTHYVHEWKIEEVYAINN